MSTSISGVSSVPALPLTELPPASSAASATVATEAAQTSSAITFGSAAARPQWLITNPGSTRSAEMLGLPSPSGSADVATLIAQISLSLELTVDDGRKKDAVGKLAAWGAALNGFDMKPLEEAVTAKVASEARVGATRTAFNTKIEALTAQRAAAPTPAAKAEIDYQIQSARMDNIDRRIADLRVDYATLDPKSAAAQANLQAQQALGTEKSGISTAVANANRDTAGTLTNIANIKEQIAIETSTANIDYEVVDRLERFLRDAEATLAGQYTALANAARTGASTDSGSAGTLLTAKKAETVVAKGALQAMATVIQAFAAATALRYGAEKAGDDITQASRDAGINVEFEDISSELRAAASRLGAIQDRLDAELGANAGTAEKRAADIALAIVASLTSVLSALASVAEGAAAPAPAPRERLRIGV